MLVEMYSAERRAEFLLSNATDEKDYTKALQEVKKHRLNPQAIPHRQPN